MTTSAPALLPVDPSGPGLAAALDRLRDAVDDVRAHILAGSVAELSDAAAAEATLRLHGAVETTTACATTLLARTAGCGYALSEGYLTPATWLRAKTGIGQSAAATRVRTAQRLAERYPDTLRRWTAGRITEEHAAVLSCGVDRISYRYADMVKRDAINAGDPLTPIQLAGRVADARPGFEGTFLELAAHHGPDVLRQVMNRAVEHVDPDGAAQSAMDAFDAQTLRIDHVGTMAVTTIHSTREVAAALRTVLDHFRDTRFRTGADNCGAREADGAGSEEPIDPVTGKPPVVRQGHLDALAFGDWVTTTLDNGLGSGKQTERPHLDITVSLTDLQQLTGTGELAATGEAIPAASVARVACDANVTLITTSDTHRDPQTGEIIDPIVAMLLNSPAEILNFGRTQRKVPPSLRRFLAHRDRGCAFPGCHRPPRYTEAHHVIPWTLDGLTNPGNTVLLCRRHHHFVHEGGWTITARAGMNEYQPGYWEFHPPPQTQR